MSFVRRRLLLAATTAAVVVPNRDKKPIYSAPDQLPELELAGPSALEYNIALARAHVEKAYDQSHSWIKHRVGGWIAVEEQVERRIKSFGSATEPLTPGVLYVLTSTLFGTVLARSSILLRFTLPPTLFLASAFRFLPETSANISNYIYGLEKEHTPELARIQSEVSRSTTNGMRAVGDGWSASRRAIENGVQKATGWIADTTGLKVHEAFGVARHTSHVVQEKATEGLHTLQEKAEKVLESK